MSTIEKQRIRYKEVVESAFDDYYNTGVCKALVELIDINYSGVSVISVRPDGVFDSIKKDI